MHLHIYKNANETTIALADWILSLIQSTLEVKDRFTIALSGGNTPKKLYHTLASKPYREKINWNKLHVFWGDERDVSFDDERNNAKMAFENLLNLVDIPSDQIHRIQTKTNSAESVVEYEKILHHYFDDKHTTFDLVLLGMGDDGHTLSLFPGSEILEDKSRWVSAINSKEKGSRITLMPTVVNRSSAIVFLLTGENKAKVLQKILEEPEQYNYPAQLIQPEIGELHWFLDHGAATYLTQQEKKSPNQ